MDQGGWLEILGKRAVTPAAPLGRPGSNPGPGAIGMFLATGETDKLACLAREVGPWPSGYGAGLRSRSGLWPRTSRVRVPAGPP
mgnify:CR=1 FL=1